MNERKQNGVTRIAGMELSKEQTAALRTHSK